MQGCAAVQQLNLDLEFDEGPKVEVKNSWQEIFPFLDGSRHFFTLCFGLFHNLIGDSLMGSQANFKSPTTSNRVHHRSWFSPHVHNGSQHDLQESYRLRNGFVSIECL